jgi:hypothetical protein
LKVFSRPERPIFTPKNPIKERLLVQSPLKGKKDGHRSHEEGDAPEAIACTGGEENLAGVSAVP